MVTYETLNDMFGHIDTDLPGLGTGQYVVAWSEEWCAGENLNSLIEIDVGGFEDVARQQGCPGLPSVDV